eukprot:14762844-Ditylum_brightwellii.AAC.1
MATLLTNQQNNNIATIVKNIRHRKEVRHSFQLLRPISKGTQGSAVLSILVPAALKSSAIYDDVLSSLCFASNWISVDNDDEVTARLILHNKLNLHQAWDTLFATGPLKEYIGEYGIGAGTQDILEGNFDLNLECNLPA